MIEFYITGQTIRFASPVIAANSRDYLTARFHFSGEDWEGCSKWAHFRQEETVYDLNLENDEISSGMHLNLSVGLWEIYLTGHKGERRITTVPVLLRVRESGLMEEPLHQIPLSVAEQVDSKASLALEKAKEIEEQLNSGALDGKNFQILGYYGSFSELEAAVEEPKRGDVYGVGAEAPYDIYVFDEENDRWVNNGSIQGPKGDKGENGATFSPQMDGSGNLSWVNDKGLPNPQTVNLRGAKGDTGPKGDSGESPYALAVKEGFSGTEATFNWSLAHIAAHGAQHKAGGTDPLTVEADNLAAGAVTAGKLATGSVTREKLANDAQYSPIVLFTADRSVTAEDMGKTLRTGGSGDGLTITLSQTVSQEMPIGAEIAYFVMYGTYGKLAFDGVKAGVYGNASALISPTFRVEKYGMVAIKKIAGESSGDTWLVTGPAEVLS